MMPRRDRKNPTRRNISKACSFCKARKRKCDGQKPCSSCLKKNFDGDCCYDLMDKRSIRFGHLKRDRSVQLDRTDTVTVAVPTTELHNGSDSDLELSEDGIYSSTPTSPSVQIESQLLNFNTDGGNPAQWEESKVQMEDNGQTRLLYDNQGNLRFIGESSPLSLLNQIRHIYSEVDLSFLVSENDVNSKLNLSKSKFLNDPRRFNFFDAPTSKPNNITNVIDHLPNKKVCDYLVDMYLQNENQLIYVFNDEYFRNVVNLIYKKPQFASSKKLCQLFLTMAIGLHHSRSTVETRELIQGLDHHVYFDCANFLLHKNLNDDGNLWLVETYMLISFYFQLTTRRNACWLNLGNGIRIAESLGLNRKKANDSYNDKEYSLHRRKLWRSLYIMDRIISLNLGRPLTISNCSWDERNLLVPDEKYSSNLRYTCEIYLANLSILNGEIYQNIYHSEKIEPNVAYKLAMNMNKWSSELPNQLKATNIFRYKNIEDIAGIRFYYLPMLLLHLIYLNGVALLSRPFFHYYFTTNIQKLITNMKSSSTEFLVPEDDPNSLIKAFADSCLNSAVFSVKFCSYYLKNKIHPLKPFTLINNIFNSGLIIGLVLLYDVISLIQAAMKNCTEELVQAISNKFNFHMKTMKVAILILKEYAQFDLFALRYREILSDIMSSVEYLLKNSLKALDEASNVKHDYNASMPNSLKPTSNLPNDFDNINLVTDDFNNFLTNADIGTLFDNEEIPNVKSPEFSFPDGEMSYKVNGLFDVHDKNESTDNQFDEMSLLNSFMYNLKETEECLKF